MKKIGPAISVVVPCYKAVRWLPECMDSLFEQTFEDFEIIFVDDGSPDATGKLVDDYAAKYPQVKTLHQKNEGVTCARRTGVAHAAGEWVCFVDADDRLPADALALLYKAAGEAYDLVIGFHHTRGVDTVLPVDELRHCCLAGELLPAAPWGKLIRRNLFATHPTILELPREIVKGEDMLMNIRLAFATDKPARVIPAQVYLYRNNDESVVHTFRPTAAYEEMYDRFRTDSIPLDLRESYFKMCLRSRLTGYMGCLIAGDVDARKSAFRQRILEDVVQSGLTLSSIERMALYHPVVYTIYCRMRQCVAGLLRKMKLRRRGAFH